MMYLVDSSIWISHFRKANPQLIKLLENNLVFTHPHIIGEIALGHLKNREQIIKYFLKLPLTKILSSDEALYFIKIKKLMGKGIGLIDTHLLAAAKITKCSLWTEDKNLLKAWESL